MSSSATFVPPPISSWESPDQANFTPPPISAWQAPGKPKADTNPAVTKAKLAEKYPQYMNDQESASSRGISSYIDKMNPFPAIGRALGYDQLKQSWNAMQQGDYSHAAGGVLQNLAEGPQGRIASDIMGAQGNEVKQAYQYAKAGRPSEAIGHGAAAFLPVVGPMAANLGEQWAGEPAAKNQVGPMRLPDRAGAVGSAAAYGTQAVAGKVLPGLPGKIGNFVEDHAISSTDPVEGQIQAIRPRSKWNTVRQDLTAASPDIKAGEAAMGHKIGQLSGTPEDYPGATTQDYIKAIRTQKNAIWDQVKSAEGAAAQRGTMVNHSNAADAATASIPETIRLSQPDKAIEMGQANNWLRQDFDVPTTEKLIQEANARLDSYYAENPAAARSTSLTNPTTAKDAAMVDQLRQNLYSRLEDQSPDENPTVRELKQRYGKLSRAEDSALARLPVAMRQAPNSLAQQIGKMEGWGDAAKAGIKIIGGAATGHGGIALSGLGDLGSALVKPEIANWIKDGGTTDTLLRRAMANHPGGAAPIAVPPPIPQLNPSRTLPPGPVRMGGVPDPSGPIEATLPQTFQLGSGLPPKPQLQLPGPSGMPIGPSVGNRTFPVPPARGNVPQMGTGPLPSPPSGAGAGGQLHPITPQAPLTVSDIQAFATKNNIPYEQAVDVLKQAGLSFTGGLPPGQPGNRLPPRTQY